MEEAPVVLVDDDVLELVATVEEVRARVLAAVEVVTAIVGRGGGKRIVGVESCELGLVVDGEEADDRELDAVLTDEADVCGEDEGFVELVEAGDELARSVVEVAAVEEGRVLVVAVLVVAELLVVCIDDDVLATVLVTEVVFVVWPVDTKLLLERMLVVLLRLVVDTELLVDC